MNTNNRQREAEFFRISDIVGPRGILPIGKSTWWAGVKAGRYPKPVKLGPNITAWRAVDIIALNDSFSGQWAKGGAGR